MRACVRMCACARARARARVYVCVCVCVYTSLYFQTGAIKGGLACVTGRSDLITVLMSRSQIGDNEFRYIGDVSSF